MSKPETPNEKISTNTHKIQSGVLEKLILKCAKGNVYLILYKFVPAWGNEPTFGVFK